MSLPGSDGLVSPFLLLPSARLLSADNQTPPTAPQNRASGAVLMTSATATTTTAMASSNRASGAMPMTSATATTSMTSSNRASGVMLMAVTRPGSQDDSRLQLVTQWQDVEEPRRRSTIGQHQQQHQQQRQRRNACSMLVESPALATAMLRQGAAMSPCELDPLIVPSSQVGTSNWLASNSFFVRVCGRGGKSSVASNRRKYMT
ncbi:unnamed protein product [Protopolystoma xenopodis]|uniref:Uncharacterized protein n=1 Tax=Protopolystoma xenopodis TaxID=117903 RepID=A0A3S5B020_9PLAT|nr:unnamed protein product [Protopolystoma xenopodis]